VIKRDLGHGAFEVHSSAEGTFKVNSQRLKHYRIGDLIESQVEGDDEPEDSPNASSAPANQ
jgi:hypothetical protein